MAHKKITPDMIKQAQELALLGFTNKQICEGIGISEATFYKDKEII